MNCARKKLRISVKKHENLSVKTRTCFLSSTYKCNFLGADNKQ